MYPSIYSPTHPGIHACIHTHHELGVHRLHLSLARALMKQRRDEELGKPIQGLGQVLVVDLELIDGVLGICAGVGVPSMLADELLPFVLTGVLLRPHKEHVFEKMSQTGDFERISKITHLNTQCNGGRPDILIVFIIAMRAAVAVVVSVDIV